MRLYNKCKKIASALLLLLLIVASCTDGFVELNDSPSLVTDTKVQPQAIFTSVLKGSIFNSYSAAGGRIGEYSQYYASQSSGDIFNVQDYTSPFNWYRYVLNLNEVLRLTADDPQWKDLRSMARVWKVWIYHIMTDAYGDIPYSQAALGVADYNGQPKYDTQQSIYTDLLNELKEAAADLGSQEDQFSIGNADILYKGDVDMWERFANSLRLRLAMRIRFADASLAATHINEVINAPLIDDNSDNASLMTLTPSSSEDNSNVNFMYNKVLTSYTPVFVGFAIADVMIPNDDPRMPIFFTPASDGTYRARPIQLNADQKLLYGQYDVASVGPLLKAKTYDIIVLNAAEVSFLRAEAALANITSEDEETMYIAGVQKSMEQYGIAEDDITAFLNLSGVSLSGTEEEQFEKIITQKYISTFFQGYQAYAEYRRTGYPKVWLGDAIGAATDNIPRRLTYPTDEYLINEVSIMEAIARMGGDTYETKVWWDVRPGLPFEHPLQNVFPPN